MDKRAHGIMFHHFHDEEKHIVGQGSISADRLYNMLNFYGKNHNILSAEEFLHRAENHTLLEKDVCLTFDDGLLCQFEIEYPVLKQYGVTAFWFIYTSPLDGVLEKLEIYRHFRFAMFHDIEEFYSEFFDMAKRTYSDVSSELQTFRPEKYAVDFPIYTPNDKRFRYLRDEVLGVEKYNGLMDRMILEHHYDVQEAAEKLWINASQIKELHNNGHIIGLHSYSHPTVMVHKSQDEQKEEYEVNKRQLETIIADKVIAVSYPCNSYDKNTLKHMQDMGIQIGFRANLADIRLEDASLEYPRQDHANILRAMEADK